MGVIRYDPSVVCTTSILLLLPVGVLALAWWLYVGTGRWLLPLDHLRRTPLYCELES